MNAERVFVEKWGTGVQPCLPEAVAHMVSRYGFKKCVDQEAARKAWEAKKSKPQTYDPKTYWGKARRGSNR